MFRIYRMDTGDCTDGGKTALVQSGAIRCYSVRLLLTIALIGRTLRVDHEPAFVILRSAARPAYAKRAVFSYIGQYARIPNRLTRDFIERAVGVKTGDEFCSNLACILITSKFDNHDEGLITIRNPFEWRQSRFFIIPALMASDRVFQCRLNPIYMFCPMERKPALFGFPIVFIESMLEVIRPDFHLVPIMSSDFQPTYLGYEIIQAFFFGGKNSQLGCQIAIHSGKTSRHLRSMEKTLYLRVDLLVGPMRCPSWYSNVWINSVFKVP